MSLLYVTEHKPIMCISKRSQVHNVFIFSRFQNVLSYVAPKILQLRLIIRIYAFMSDMEKTTFPWASESSRFVFVSCQVKTKPKISLCLSSKLTTSLLRLWSMTAVSLDISGKIEDFRKVSFVQLQAPFPRGPIPCYLLIVYDSLDTEI